MNPLRSISMLPKIGESQGESKWFEDRFTGNDKHIRNYRAYDYRTDGLDKDISWITDVPNDQMYIEVSYKDGNNQHVSRKFDFGNFLRYIGHCLSVLDKGINDIYLTEERAKELFLPIGGGTLTGPLTIEYTNKTSPALMINSTDSVGAKCGLVLYGDLEVENEGLKTTITYDTVDTTYLSCTSFETKSNSTINGNLTITNNANVGNILTASQLTLASDGSFNLCDIFYKTANSIQVTVPLETAGIDNSTSDTPVSTKYLNVSESVTLEKNLTVNGTTTVKALIQTEGKATLKTVEADSVKASGNVEGGTVKSNGTITASGDITTTGGDITATNDTKGTITGRIIVGNKTIQINGGNVQMDIVNGLKNTVKISELTAQYACWA